MPLGIDVRIELAGRARRQPIQALGRVVRVAGTDEKGIRIDSIAPRGRGAPRAARPRARAGRPAHVEGPMSKKKSKKGAAEATEGAATVISVGAHPRARASIRRTRARTALARLRARPLPVA